MIQSYIVYTWSSLSYVSACNPSSSMYNGQHDGDAAIGRPFPIVFLNFFEKFPKKKGRICQISLPATNMWQKKAEIDVEKMGTVGKTRGRWQPRGQGDDMGNKTN